MSLIHSPGRIISGIKPRRDVPPLDAIAATPTAAYSFRQLRAAYTGSLITARRASDAASLAIGFDEYGDFDAATYTAFIGASTGTLAAWADQSAYANSAAQATAGIQPTIGVYQGNYGAHGQDQGAQMIAAPDAPQIQNIFTGNAGGFIIMAITLETKPTNISTLCGKGSNGWTFYGNSKGPNISVNLALAGTTGNGLWTTNAVVPISLTHILDVAFDASGAYAAPPIITVDGKEATIAASTGYGGTAISDSDGALEMFNATNTSGNAKAWDGAIYEALFFKAMPSASDIATLRANLMTYFGLA
jgi:hypothetical protein